MTRVADMLRTHPEANAADGSLAEVIDALVECAATCTICADACLAEEDVATLRHCIRLNLDCAALCSTAANILTRQHAADPNVLRATVRACVAACNACAEECAQHAGHMEHCAICAETCRACAEACSRLLERLERAA